MYMTTKDFTTTFLADATPQQVFDSVNNVRGWWSENIEGDTDKAGSEFTYHYEDVHICKMKITELIPGKKIMWHVLDNHFNFTKDASEWKGTDVIFEIAEKDGKTQLTFTHRGLTPEYECYNICHDAWTHYIQESLKNLILTGKGKATPEDNEATSGQAENISRKHITSLGIHHRLRIDKPAETVYENLTTQKGLAGWWTPETVATPEVGSVSKFSFGDYHKEIKVEALKPYSYVKWRCLKAFEEWIDTTITFELEPHAKGTILILHHEGWKIYSNEFASCSYDWALFLRSLKFLCEKGKGFPYPDFDK
jgi:uncharacterized protein YndB with AHSA1/START domain